MAAMDFERALARIRRDGVGDHTLASTGGALAPLVEQLCGEMDHLWRERLLTPIVTVRLFVLQVLHGNTAITHLRHLAGFAFAASSYCEARERLPLRLLQELLRRMARAMRLAGVAAAAPAPFVPQTTDSDHDSPVGPNVLDRAFDAEAHNEPFDSAQGGRPTSGTCGRARAGCTLPP